jgi:metal-responsive CopG/Arc/MetJ family transcriptional regulator
MKQFSITLESEMVKDIDLIVKKERMHNSRNDFVRDAVRSKIMEFRKLNLRLGLKELAQKAVERGWDGSLLTEEEKIKIADDYLKKRGIDPKTLQAKKQK